MSRIDKKVLFDRILPVVSKPGRYVGNELNMIRKVLDDVCVRFALVFPDVYEVGMSYMGFPILYHILNKRAHVYAERAFSPWVDMEALMREFKIPLFTLETFSPLSDFDIVGFTLQYELSYTTILNLLDLSGIPQYSAERKSYPLVIAGGPSAYNPEPLADFFDAFVIGDGEYVVQEIADLVEEMKNRGTSREKTLRRLAELDGVYVPSLYQPIYSTSGSYAGITVDDAAAPAVVRASFVERLEKEFYPLKPLVPVIQTAHDRISLEIARGCSRGCRFCNAGFIYRPVRERTIDDIVDQACRNIESTGYDEVSLVSLSTSDYTQLPLLMSVLDERLANRMVNLSFPSLRPESFTPQVARFAKNVRKSGLTLAPEAGSQRLRRVINKATTADELMRAITLAFREGWQLVKLYFMIGQPTETMEDVRGLVRLVKQVGETARSFGNRRINLSISPFVPKSFTPFQWTAQDSLEKMRHKIDLLCREIRDRNVKVSWRQPELAQIEGMLARGDRRLAAVIQRAWELGAKLEGWSEFFDTARWQQALRERDLAMEQFLEEISVDAALPWGHIDSGVGMTFLKREYERALLEEITPDCREHGCTRCGLMSHTVCRELMEKTKTSRKSEAGDLLIHQETVDQYHGFPENPPAVQKRLRVARICYAKGEEARFFSHLDMIRLFTRALRRAGIPLVYTVGYNPRPRLSFGPALPTGFASHAEYFDVSYSSDRDLSISHTLKSQLPLGIDILSERPVLDKRDSLIKQLGRADYRLCFSGRWPRAEIDEKIDGVFRRKSLTCVRRKRDGRSMIIDIRPLILSLRTFKNGLNMQLKMENGHSVRIDEVLDHILPDKDSFDPAPLVTRTGLWIMDGEAIRSPMDPSPVIEDKKPTELKRIGN